MSLSTAARTEVECAPRRTFRLLDALILIAATAIGFSAIRRLERATDGSVSFTTVRELGPNVIELLETESLALAIPNAASLFLISVALVSPLILTWTLALIPVHLTAARTSEHRRLKSPGMTVVMALGLVVAFYGIPIGIGSIGGAAGWVDNTIEVDPGAFIEFSLTGTAVAVLVSWLTLYTTLRWQSERDWQDRLGRILGVLWIVAGFGAWWCWALYEGTEICQFGASLDEPALSSSALMRLWSILNLSIPFVALGMFGLVAIQLFKARSRIWSELQSPGIMAAIAVTVTLISIGVPVGTALAITDYGWANLEYWLPVHQIIEYAARLGGLAILACWTTMLACRVWLPQPRWLDRCGRAIGFYWIAAAFSIMLISCNAAGESETQVSHYPCPRPRRVEELLTEHEARSWETDCNIARVPVEPMF